MQKLKNLWKNKELGISIFPNRDSKEKILQYIKLAYSFGFKRTFTNLIGLSKDELNNFKNICKDANKIGMKMVIDIDKEVLNLFGVDLDDIDFFEKLGAYAIRLDVKFDAKKIAMLTNKTNMNFEINASDFSGLDKELKKTSFDNTKVVASHNFFPQRYTGLSIEKFNLANKLFKDVGIKTSAFVTLNSKEGISAWKESEGTPTLEIFRNMEIIDQIQFLLNSNDINYIIISDMYVSEEIMQKILFLRERHLIFNLDVQGSFSSEKFIIEYNNHQIRGDNPDDIMLRSIISRKIFKNLSIKPIKIKLDKFKRGSVVILNNLAGRYKGELHILKKDIPYSNNKNYIGKIKNNQFTLLDMKVKNLKFRF